MQAFGSASEEVATPASGPLGPIELVSFKANGFVIVRGLVGEEQLQSFREQFWHHIGADPHDCSTWPPAPPGGGQLPNIMAPRPNLGELPGVAAIVEQLGGGRFTGGGSMTKAIFPLNSHRSAGQSQGAEGALSWARPTGFHIDGYAGTWNHNPEFGATLYLDSVEEQGGCFCVKPGEHIRTHQYFQQHPHHVDGSFQKTAAYQRYGWRCLYEQTAEPQADELQFSGGAGDILFWHGFTPHCASLNANKTPRLAMIARWRDPDRSIGATIKMSEAGDDKTPLGWADVDAVMREREARFHFGEDMWQHWGEELRDAGSPMPGLAHREVTNILGGCSRATITVPGLAEPLRVMHLSDSHTGQGPDEGSGSAMLCEWMHNCYHTGIGRPGGQRQQLERRDYPIEAVDALHAELELAARENVELILHTGDLINFPSPRASTHAAALLHQSKRPLGFRFISGNHDWQHSPVTLPNRSPAQLRAEAETVLEPLFDNGARRQDYWAEDVKGIRFVGIDNSSGRFSEQQLAFFTQSTAGSMPVVLMIHIPLFVPALLKEGRKDGITPLSARAHLCATPPSTPRKPAETARDCDRETMAFADAVRSCSQLVAVLCGHIHDANSHALVEGVCGPVQYTADAGCYGASRVIDFVPPSSKL